MRRIVTIGFTGLEAGGGVPAFNRAIHSVFADRECKHFCWIDHPWAGFINEPEWLLARRINAHLIATKQVTEEDVVIADGFWADGLDHLPLVVSHSHGIWSHLTKDDVAAGKQPDMPLHHAAQVSFRKKWTTSGKRLTAVSKFIADQMDLQWGFKVDRIINNGVDTDLFRPMIKSMNYDSGRPLVIHGINDRGNVNKGWDHIQAVIEVLPEADVMSLDEAVGHFAVRSDRPWKKHEVLAQADLVVHPSGYEGNSMFVAEALACGVPVIGYNVGFLYEVDPFGVGRVLDRNKRSPELTASAVRVDMDYIMSDKADPSGQLHCYKRHAAREVSCQHLSLASFRDNWRSYVEEIEAKHAA